MGKMTAQEDTIIDITSDSQVNSNFPNRWSPACLTFNNYFYLFLYLYITRITINNKATSLFVNAVRHISLYHGSCKAFKISNDVALRKTKIVYNFGLSECNRIKMNGYTFRKSNSAIFISLPAQWELLFKQRVCSIQEQFFLLRVGPILEELHGPRKVNKTS